MGWVDCLAGRIEPKSLLSPESRGEEASFSVSQERGHPVCSEFQVPVAQVKKRKSTGAKNKPRTPLPALTNPTVVKIRVYAAGRKPMTWTPRDLEEF